VLPEDVVAAEQQIEVAVRILVMQVVIACGRLHIPRPQQPAQQRRRLGHRVLVAAMQIRMKEDRDRGVRDEARQRADEHPRTKRQPDQRYKGKNGEVERDDAPAAQREAVTLAADQLAERAGQLRVERRALLITLKLRDEVAPERQRVMHDVMRKVRAAERLEEARMAIPECAAAAAGVLDQPVQTRLGERADRVAERQTEGDLDERSHA
jgi:hypothetical protein